jgi:hypothetical protein
MRGDSSNYEGRLVKRLVKLHEPRQVESRDATCTSRVGSSN